MHMLRQMNFSQLDSLEFYPATRYECRVRIKTLCSGCAARGFSFPPTTQRPGYTPASSSALSAACRLRFFPTLHPLSFAAYITIFILKLLSYIVHPYYWSTTGARVVGTRTCWVRGREV